MIQDYYLRVCVMEYGLGVAWCESRFMVLCSGFRFGQWSSPQKRSYVGDLTAQASGQALIRGCESTGSASRSVFSFYTLLSHSLILLSPSPLCLSAACRFVSSSSPLPQDSLRPSFHQRKTSPLALSMATPAVFIRLNFIILCVSEF